MIDVEYGDGTPTKRLVSKRQVSKRPVSKRLKRQVYKTSGLQNVRFTKSQVYKTSGLKNFRSSKRLVAKKEQYIFCTCGWWKSAGSVAAMFAGKVMAVLFSIFEIFCHISPYWLVISKNDKYKYFLFDKYIKFRN
jgi:hypothetical protein